MALKKFYIIITINIGGQLYFLVVISRLQEFLVSKALRNSTNTNTKSRLYSVLISMRTMRLSSDGMNRDCFFLIISFGPRRFSAAYMYA